MESNEDEFDPDLNAQVRNSNSIYAATSISGAEDDDDIEGDIEVELPEDLQKLLVLSPKTRKRDEEALVSSLLYGKGSNKYSVKGAEIYSAGEIEASEFASSDEDTWAGEGVPWEVAEL